MTVRELMEKLSQFPPETEVVAYFMDDDEEFSLGEIELEDNIVGRCVVVQLV